MNVEIGTDATQFLFLEYINRIYGTSGPCLRSPWRTSTAVRIAEGVGHFPSLSAALKYMP